METGFEHRSGKKKSLSEPIRKAFFSCAGQITREKGRASIMAWLGHIQHGDTWGLRRKLFHEIIA